MMRGISFLVAVAVAMSVAFGGVSTAVAATRTATVRVVKADAAAGVTSPSWLFTCTKYTSTRRWRSGICYATPAFKYGNAMGTTIDTALVDPTLYVNGKCYGAIANMSVVDILSYKSTAGIKGVSMDRRRVTYDVSFLTGGKLIATERRQTTVVSSIRFF